MTQPNRTEAMWQCHHRLGVGVSLHLKVGRTEFDEVVSIVGCLSSFNICSSERSGDLSDVAVGDVPQSKGVRLLERFTSCINTICVMKFANIVAMKAAKYAVQRICA